MSGPGSDLKFYECDSCGYEVDGWTKRELSAEGWQWHSLKHGREFAMCSDCVTHYQKRRGQ